MKNLVMAFFILFSSMNLVYAAGPGVTGGGEPISQEFMSIAKSLPAVIMSKGQQLFPEISMEDLAQFVSDGFQVELKNYLFEEGAPKAARFYKDLRKVQVDPSMWNQLTTQVHGDAAKRALVFHEVLGLMGFEGNNDYTISNRLLGLETLSLFNIGASKNQIFPKDMKSNSVIFWKDSKNKQRSFYFCQDRNVAQTCKLLGNRSFSIEELNVYANQKIAKSTADYNKSKNVFAATLGVFVVGVLFALTGPGSLIFASSAFAYQFTLVFSGVGSLLLWEHSSVKSDEVGKQNFISNVITKGIPDRGNFDNLDKLAQVLHESLSSISSSNSSQSSLN